MKRVILLVTAFLFLLSLNPVSAITALGPGYYQNTDASLVYTGTWTTGTASTPSYGGSFAVTSSLAARVTIYTLPTVSSFGVYYAMNSLSGSFNIDLNGVTVASVITYSPTNILNQYVQIALPAGTNKIEMYSASSSFYYHAVQLLAASASTVNVTAVLSLPTHTPTPTATPTLTPTAGPSPTPTRTPAPTPNSSTTYYSDSGEDVVIVREVRPADAAIVALLVLLVGLQIAPQVAKIFGGRD